MISAVVLAAGCSSRMGKDKLLVPLNSGTVLGHTINNVLISEIDEVFVVLGHRASEKEKYVKNNFEDLKTVINEDYHQGLSSSVRKGLDAVNSDCQAVIFCPGDLPLVSPAVVRGLIQLFQEQQCPVVYPEYMGIRGNPVLFSKEVFPLFENLSGDEGGRSIIIHSEKRACILKTDCEGVLRDIDTPEDLLKIRSKMK